MIFLPDSGDGIIITTKKEEEEGGEGLLALIYGTSRT